MKSLVDEIICALPDAVEQIPFGPTVKDIAAHIAADQNSVRQAFEQIARDGLAVIVKRMEGRAGAASLRILPLGTPIFACKHCRNEFQRQSKSKRMCCSRKCAMAWSWTRPGVKERRAAGIKARCAEPAGKARLEAHNKERWSNPEQRRKLSEWNRKRWADPEIKARLSAAIELVQQTPEMRALYSKLRTECWNDPAMREKYVKGIQRSKGSPESRALFSKLLQARWNDPVWRKKYMRAVYSNSKKGADAIRGKKQPPEQVAKRVASVRKTLAERRA